MAVNARMLKGAANPGSLHILDHSPLAPKIPVGMSVPARFRYQVFENPGRYSIQRWRQPPPFITAKRPRVAS